MIDSIIGVSMPCKIAMFGKSRHGLLKMPTTQAPDTRELVIDPQDITLVNQDGVESPAASYGGSYERFLRVQPDTMYGAAILYMHPMATIQPVEPDGRDWSGYVVFTPDAQEKPPGSLAGYHGDADFAFTPDDNTQGLLARLILGSGYIRFAKPIKLGDSVDFTSINSDVLVDIPSLFSKRMFAASADGRVIYIGSFPTIYDMSEWFDTDYWDEYYKAVIYKTMLSGGVGLDGELDITSESSPVDSMPTDIRESESNYEVLYSRSAVYTALIGECVPVDAAPLVENIKDSTDGYNPPFGRPTAFMSFLRRYTRTEKATVISAALVGSIMEYLVFSREYIYEANGAGDINANAEPYDLGDECGVNPNLEQRIVIGSYSRFDRWSETDNKTTSRYKIEGYGGSSVIEHISGGAESVTAGWENVGEVTTEYETQETTSYESITLDGKVLYYEDDAGSDPGLYSLIWPTLPNLSGFAEGGIIDTIFLVKNGEGYEGKETARISFRIFGYHSSDLLALSAIVQTGVIYKDGDTYKVSEGTHTAKLHIGKTFARGVVDNYVHEQDLINNPIRSWRAYDPLGKKVSAVYPHPIFYV